MADIAFALTAVTIDERLVRQCAAAARGRLIRLDEDETHRRWSSALYAEIEEGNVLASLRSPKHIWLLLGCDLRKLGNRDVRDSAKDAAGESIEVLAQLFFMYELTQAAPFGYVPYVGALHVAVDEAWRTGAKYLAMLDVRLKPIHAGRWQLQMRSISYTAELSYAGQVSRCFTVRHVKASKYRLVPTPKQETREYLAYATIEANTHRVPWKSRQASQEGRLDKFGLLQVLLTHMQPRLGLEMLKVNVMPLQQYRQVGSSTTAKRELMHEHVICQAARSLENYRFHVTSHRGQPEFMACLMAQMFPFAEWLAVDQSDAWPGIIEHLLAVVNTPVKGQVTGDDAKVIMRARHFPILQCLTESTLDTIVKSIEKRIAKVNADAAAGKAEARRPPQEHEMIGRALLIQLLLKIELRQGKFLMPRPWMGHVKAHQYAFVYREFGEKRWVVVKPNDNFHFEVAVGEQIHHLLTGGRIPVLIDPPEKGRDNRGREYGEILARARRSIVIRSSEINAYSAQRRGHAGVWLIPELFAYISLGADAAASDLSTKVAPRLRIVDAYEYGLPVDEAWRWEAALDMATLAYDPTVRLFKTSAFPVFVKLAAEKLDALSMPPFSL